MLRGGGAGNFVFHCTPPSQTPADEVPVISCRWKHLAGDNVGSQRRCFLRLRLDTCQPVSNPTRGGVVSRELWYLTWLSIGHRQSSPTFPDTDRKRGFVYELLLPHRIAGACVHTIPVAAHINTLTPAVLSCRSGGHLYPDSERGKESIDFIKSRS